MRMLRYFSEHKSAFASSLGFCIGVSKMNSGVVWESRVIYLYSLLTPKNKLLLSFYLYSSIGICSSNGIPSLCMQVNHVVILPRLAELLLPAVIPSVNSRP